RVVGKVPIEATRWRPILPHVRFGGGRLETQVTLCAGRLSYFVIGCQLEADARKIMAVLPKRLARFGLTIHPTKTTLIAFRKSEAHQGPESGNGTCTFLGLTHYWTKSVAGHCRYATAMRGHALLTVPGPSGNSP